MGGTDPHRSTQNNAKAQLETGNLKCSGSSTGPSEVEIGYSINRQAERNDRFRDLPNLDSTQSLTTFTDSGENPCGTSKYSVFVQWRQLKTRKWVPDGTLSIVVSPCKTKVDIGVVYVRMSMLIVCARIFSPQLLLI